MQEILTSSMKKLMRTMNEIKDDFKSRHNGEPISGFYMDIGVNFLVTCIANVILANKLATYSQKKQAVNTILEALKDLIKKEFDAIGEDK